MRWLPAKGFEDEREVVKHKDRLEGRIAVSFRFVVQVQPQRRQNFRCKQTLCLCNELRLFLYTYFSPKLYQAIYFVLFHHKTAVFIWSSVIS